MHASGDSYLPGWLKRAPAGWALLILTILSAALYIDVLPGRAVFVMDDGFGSDLLNLNIPMREAVGDALRAGEAPLWTNQISMGAPLMAQGEAAALYPFTWILYGVFDWITATNLSLWIHTLLAGMGMFLWIRQLSLRWTAAVIAGVSFMFCGFLIIHGKHMNLHHATVWIPWVLLFVDRIRERPSWQGGLLLGAVSSLMVTAGHPQVVFIALFFVVPFFLYRLISSATSGLQMIRWRYWAAMLISLALASGVAFVLSWGFLMAGAELMLSDARAVDTDAYSFATTYTFAAQMLATLFLPYSFGDLSNGTYNPGLGIFWESFFYVGFVVIAAAIAFAASRFLLVHRGWRWGWSLLLFAMLSAILAISLMLGKNSVIYELAFEIVPLLDWFRFHQRFGIILTIAVILIGALGLSNFMHTVLRQRSVRTASILAAVLILLTATELIWVMARQLPAVDKDEVALTPPTVDWLREQGVPEAEGISKDRVYSALAPELHAHVFRSMAGWQDDAKPLASLWPFLQPSMNMLWDVAAVNGYTSLRPNSVARTLSPHRHGGVLIDDSVVNRRHNPRCDRKDFSEICDGALLCQGDFHQWLAVFGTRYLLSPHPSGGCSGWTSRATFPAGDYTVHLLENMAEPQDVLVLDRIQEVSSFYKFEDLVRRGGIDPALLPRTGVVFEKDAESLPRLVWEPELPGSCQLNRNETTSLEIACDLTREALVAIGLTHYPGWRVTRDGEPLDTLPVHGMLTGWLAPAGQSTFQVSYNPPWRWSILVALMGWLALGSLGLTVLIRRRLRRRSA